jgi:hypothetical protein
VTEEEVAPTVAELRRLMDEGLGRLLTTVDQLDPARIEDSTDAQGWSAEDHLAHLAIWVDGIAALLRTENRWAAMGLDITDADRDSLGADGINDLVVDRHRDLTPAQARAWLMEAHSRLGKAVESLSDDDLMRPYGSFTTPPDDKGHPIFGYVVGNTFEHYDEHLPWIVAIAR